MSQPLRVIFAGTPEFAAEALAQILAAGHTVPLVLTQPDRPAGRGMKLHASAVKQLAVQHHIPVAQPLSLRLDGKYPDDAAAAQAAIAEANADVMVVAAYGLILPQWTLDAPRLGCLNIHASLLPRWRGAAPVQHAIWHGDDVTGASTFTGLQTCNGGMTVNGAKITAPATTTSYASLNLPTGSAPTSPVDGDVWREDNTDTGLKIRINGVTKTITVS